MDNSFYWKIVVGKRRFTSGHRTVEEKRKTATIIEEPSDELHEKLKHGGRTLAFGSDWTALCCLDPNNNNSRRKKKQVFFDNN